jgi:hypothetical protein
MTPKKKAWDLNQKFIELQHYIENDAWNNSKQCALITVDEIIASNPIAFDEDDNCIAKQWWQEVKTEIEKL